MKRKKMILALTLVLFSTSLFAARVNGQSPQRLRHHGFQNQNRSLMEALDLSDEQKEELRKLREAQKEMLDQFREKARNFHEELKRLQEDPENNRVQIENLQDELFNLRLERMKDHYALRKEIKKVFTTEQLEKISLIRSLRKRRGPGRHGSVRSYIRRWRR